MTKVFVNKTLKYYNHMQNNLVKLVSRKLCYSKQWNVFIINFNLERIRMDRVIIEKHRLSYDRMRPKITNKLHLTFKLII